MVGSGRRQRMFVPQLIAETGTLGGHSPKRTKALADTGAAQASEHCASCLGVYTDALGSSGEPSDSRSFDTPPLTGVTNSVGITASI